MKKELTEAKKFEEFMLGLSYKHDNEITLCIDDVWEYIQQQREEMVKALREKVYNVTRERFDMAIFDSEDFERGFRQGFEVCWNKIIDKIDNYLKTK